MSLSTLTPLTLNEFRAWFPEQDFCNGVPTATCLHNTTEPTTAQWNGLASMKGIRAYHKNTRGWSDIGANLYVGPDDRIWTGRPFDRSNWSHGLVTKPWSQVHPDAVAYCNGDTLALNKRAVGVEVVGDYDREDPLTSRAMSLALDVFAIMHDAFGIPLGCLLEHRMVANTDCPGSRVSLSWFRSEVASRMGGVPVPTPGPLKVVGLDGKAIDADSPWGDCHAELVNGVTRVDLSVVASALGFDTFWRPDKPQGPRVYIKAEEP